MNQKISVVIPAYNPGSYLLEALESVKAQTFLPAEVVVVDDGSRDPVVVDGTWPFPVRLFRQKNAGQAMARNFGVKVATGDLIAFLDADDLWHPRKLELQMNALEEDSSCACVGCRAVLVGKNGEFIGVGPGEFSGGRVPLRREEFLSQSTKAILVPSMALVRRSVALEIGGFDSRFQPIEDLVFFDRFFTAGKTCVMVEKPLLKRRMHGENLTYQFSRMLKSYRAWVRTYVQREAGEAQARRVLGAAYLVTGLSALAVGDDRAARALLKQSYVLEPARETLLPFALACIGSGFTSFLRSLKRSVSSEKARAVYARSLESG